MVVAIRPARSLAGQHALLRQNRIPCQLYAFVDGSIAAAHVRHLVLMPVGKHPCFSIEMFRLFQDHPELSILQIYRHK